MASKIAGAIVFIIVSGYLLLAFLPPLASNAHTVRVNSASESLGCTTAAGATTCVVTLANAHGHGDTSHLTITETSPGAGARSGTLALTDRTALTITGLTAATTYVFTTAYEVVDSDIESDLGELLRFWPLLLLATLGVVVFLAWKSVGRTGAFGR